MTTRSWPAATSPSLEVGAARGLLPLLVVIGCCFGIDRPAVVSCLVDRLRPRG